MFTKILIGKICDSQKIDAIMPSEQNLKFYTATFL